MADGKTVRVLIDVVANDHGAKDAKKAVNDLGNEAKRINKETTDQAKQQYKVRQEAHRQSVKSMEADIKRLEQEEKRAAKSAADAFIASMRDVENERKESAAFASAAFRSSGAIIAAVIAAEIYGIGKLGQAWFNFSVEATEAAAKFERTRNALTAISEGATFANQELASLETLARNTPGLGLETAEQGFLRLRSVGFEAERARELLAGLSKVKILSGSTQEDLDAVVYNLTQIKALGRLTGDELRESLGRMPALGAVIQKAFGTLNTKQIAELKLTSGEFFDRLTKGLAEVKAASGGTEDAWQKLNDQWLLSKRAFGEPILEPAADSLRILTKILEENRETFADWGLVTANVLGGINDLIPKVAASLSSLPESFDQMIKKATLGAADFNKVLDILTFGANSLLTGQRKAYAELAENQKRSKALESSVTAFTDAIRKANAEIEKESLAKFVKDAEFLNNTVKNLSLQIQFFGDDSQIAATKQRLLTEGITDFNSSLAKSAISLAKQLDKLKETKKATDSLRELRRNASFDIAFPKATELDKFENWVKRNIANFAELKGEIEATRRVLSIKLDAENIGKYLEGLKSVTEMQQTFRSSFDRDVRSVLEASDKPFTAKMESFAESLLTARNISISAIARDASGVNIFPQDFASQVTKFVATLNRLREEGVDTSEMTKRFSTYLSDLGFVTLETGEKVRLFSDTTIKDLAEKFVVLDKVLRANQIKSALTELIPSQGLRLGSLGIVRTEVQKINELLSDPANAEAILNYAKALGVTTDELKKIGLQAAGIKDNLNFTNLQRGLKDQLESVQRNNKPLTELERVQREIERNYKNLSASQKQDLLNTAAQIDATTRFVETQSKLKDFFTDLFDDAIGGRWKNMLDRMLDQAKQFVVKLLAEFASRKLANIFLGGSSVSPQQSGGGFNFGNILNQIFGGGIFGGQPGATPPFNPNNFTGSGGASAGAGMTGSLSSLFSIGNLAAAGSGTGFIIGLNALVNNSKKDDFLAGVLGLGVGWLRGLFGGGAEKKLRQAAESAYTPLKIKDKNILKSLKSIGEGYFGKGQAGKNAPEVVKKDESIDLLKNYAEATGQKVPKLTDGDLTDAFNPRNNFSSRFSGFEPVSLSSIPSSSFSADSNYSGASRQSGGDRLGAMLMLTIATLTESIDTFTQNFSVKTEGVVVANGLNQNPAAAADAYESELKGDGQRLTNLKRLTLGEA